MTLDVSAPDAEWDAWVADAGVEGDFLQTSEWAAIDDAVNSRVSAVLRAGASVGALVSWPQENRGELLCYHGPIVREWQTDAVAAVAAGARDLAVEHRCDGVRVIGRPARSGLDVPRLCRVFEAAGYAVTPWCTAVVDVARPDAELLASFDRSVRKALRRCADVGVRVRRCETAAEMESVFYEAYASSVEGFDRARGLAVHALDRNRRYAYWVACAEDGTVLATLGTYSYGGVLTEVLSARTPAGVAVGAPAQDLLHWEVMRDHRDNGGAWFDLAGYAAAPATPKEEGIRRFKRKWGGRETSTPTFVLPVAGGVRRRLRRVGALLR